MIREALRLLKEAAELRRIRREEVRREGVNEVRSGKSIVYNATTITLRPSWLKA
jgi:hypothetical protein